MGSQGFHNVAGNPFVYQEDTLSAAIGIDVADQYWVINVSSAPGALPVNTAQVIINPAGNIRILPNVVGNVILDSVYYPKSVVKGDVLVASADTIIGVVTGATTAGYILTANGAGTAPTFQVAAAGGIGTLAGDSGTATGATVTVSGGSNLTSSATAATLTINLDNSPTVTGTLTGLTLATSAAAANTSITGATISALGSDVNIGITVTPKGSGNLVVSSGSVSVTAGHILLPATNYAFTQGVYKIGTYKAIHMLGGNTNIWVGDEAANSRGTGFYQSCTYNTGVGYSAMGELWDASHYNTAIGANALTTLGNPSNSGAGSGNTCIGYSALGTANADVSYNTCVGYAVLNTDCTTKYSLMLGYNCGSGVSGGQGQGSSCIYLMNAGAAESNKIRIGTQGTGNGQQNAAYIAGTYGVTPGGTINVALVDSNGQLGSVATLAQSYLVNGLTWNAPTTSPVTAAVNNEYTIKTASGLTTINLPATAAINARIKIVGYGTDGWTLVAAAGDVIHYGSSNTSAGGSLASTHRYDCVEAVCAVADSEWVVHSSVGTLVVA
jgi:hypothetical protein